MKMLKPLPPPSSSPWSQFYPRTYVAPYVPPSLLKGDGLPIDGNLTKEVWSLASWSDTFDDICGPGEPSEGGRPPPTCTTKVKMMWDDDHLYIGAHIVADGYHPVVTTYTERNSPIFQQDSDFEVFVDPTGGMQHDYKEYEVNAWNTVWNLLLDKPYGDGGHEHSGRIAKPGEPDYYDVQHQKSATSVLQGHLNSNDGTCIWTVEIAMAYSDLLVGVRRQRQRQPPPPHKSPQIHDRWRINFSRVERRGAINWTWQPQIVWDASSRQYRGVVDMHRPDAWGYLYFGETGNTETATRDEELPPKDPTWLLRFAAMNVYYAQHEHKRAKGEFGRKLCSLEPYMDQPLVEQFAPVDIQITPTEGFVATLRTSDYTATIRDDRLLEVSCNTSPN